MSGIAAAYDASGAAWRTGPEGVYERLAAALLDHGPRAVAGCRVLDVGAGTGAAGRAAARRGAALVVSTDIAAGMLRHCHPGLGRVVAHAQVLPFADRAFDLAVVAFALGHLDDPVAALRETRRVAGAVAASAFAPSWGHPAKQAIDDTMARHGFLSPPWYAAIKATEGRVEDPDGLAGLAREAGYARVEVTRVEVDAGLPDARAVVDWRWGMAHLAPFVATLEGAARDRARADAEAAVTGLPPVVVPMLALSAD